MSEKMLTGAVILLMVVNAAFLSLNLQATRDTVRQSTGNRELLCRNLEARLNSDFFKDPKPLRTAYNRRCR